MISTAPTGPAGPRAQAALSLDFYRMTPFEVATGWLSGFEPWNPVDGRVPGHPRHPRQALEQALLPSVTRPPCLIAFSGGRDSSLVLAAALAVARRHGLPAPVALTRVHPGVAEADESRWQERVIGHLGVGEWCKVPVDDEIDLVGPLAGPGLRRFGLLWPPMVHANIPLLDLAQGGSLATGEGGDAVLGPQRVTPVAALAARARRRCLPGPRLLAAVLAAATPAPLRRSSLRRQTARTLGISWLRPQAHDELCRRLAHDEASEPLDWRHGVHRRAAGRALAVGLRNMGLVASTHQVALSHPLVDPVFVESLARAGGRLGFVGRTALMRELFADLLPVEVLARTSKATFNRAAVHRHARAFAWSWEGQGMDGALGELVDPQALQREWLTTSPHAMSLALLQAAWLATEAAA